MWTAKCAPVCAHTTFDKRYFNNVKKALRINEVASSSSFWSRLQVFPLSESRRAAQPTANFLLNRTNEKLLHVRWNFSTSKTAELARQSFQRRQLSYQMQQNMFLMWISLKKLLSCRNAFKHQQDGLSKIFFKSKFK